MRVLFMLTATMLLVSIGIAVKDTNSIYFLVSILTSVLLGLIWTGIEKERK